MRLWNRTTAYSFTVGYYTITLGGLAALWLAHRPPDASVGHPASVVTLVGLVAISLVLRHMDIPSLTTGTNKRTMHNFSPVIYFVTVLLWGWPSALWLAVWDGFVETAYRWGIPQWYQKTPQQRLLQCWLRILDKPPHYPQRIGQHAATYIQNATLPFLVVSTVAWAWQALGILDPHLLIAAPLPKAWPSLLLIGWTFGIVLVNNWGNIASIGLFLSWPDYQALGRSTIWRDSVTVTRIEATIALLALGATALWNLWGLFLVLIVVYEMMVQLTRQRRITEQEQIIAQEREASRTDPLTHLPNRRSLEEYAQSVTDAGLPAIVAIFDIDHFKQVNDTWGHDVGDLVLKTVAERLTHACRTQRTPWPDIVGRWGGEEFVVILPQMPRDIAETR
ncbi:MAG: hypothetical protein C7B46_20740, partial [Sulfobacillus benefaciens]